MKNLALICFCIAIPVALAEGPRSSGMEHLRSDSKLLEPLIPFTEAVEKAKNQVLQGEGGDAVGGALGERTLPVKALPVKVEMP